LDSESCIKAVKSAISLFGVPNRIIADQERCFTGAKFSEFCSDHKINLHLIATGASRANGQVKRTMSTLKNREVPEELNVCDDYNNVETENENI